MSTQNSTIFIRKNPPLPNKISKEISITEDQTSATEIPSRLLQLATQTCETKTELVVYLAILRYSLGFNRDKCTLSRRFIARWTGLHFQNVGRGIEGLIANGMIEKVLGENANRGDMFKVLHLSKSPSSENEPVTRNQNDYTRKAQSNQVDDALPVIKVMSDGNQVDDGSSSIRLRSVITPITKNKLNELKESSLISENISAHLKGLPKAHMKRLEQESLDELLKTYTSSQIDEALAYVKTKGTVGSQSPCAMPLCYLAKSIDRVLDLAWQARSKEEKKLHLLTLAEQRQKLEADKERACEEAINEATKTFEKVHPDPKDREEILSSILREKFHLLNGSGQTARKIAVRFWFSKIHKKSA